MRKSSASIVCLGIGLCQPFAACLASAAPPLGTGIEDTYSGPTGYYSSDLRSAFMMMVDRIDSSAAIGRAGAKH